eukprot:9198185-Pyramimonas_sp.AAC.1
MIDQSGAGCAGIFSRRTNRAWVYLPARPPPPRSAPPAPPPPSCAPRPPSCAPPAPYNNRTNRVRGRRRIPCPWRRVGAVRAPR